MKSLKVVILIICLIFLGECFLRQVFGFGNMVLVREDTTMEYIPKPNQSLRRFGNDIFYNSYSMRSPSIEKNSKKILGFGDSVINGGSQTGNKDLATSIISDSLTSWNKKHTQVLNISYGSWGPDNCFAYLKKHGDWDADNLFLWVSSHDAFDNRSFKKVVGVNESFPSKNYISAYFEIWDRYLKTRIFKTETPKNLQNRKRKGIQKKGKTFNTGFLDFHTYCKEKEIPFFIILHPETEELKNGSYNSNGQLIIDFCQENNIPLLRGLDFLSGPDSYRDIIHINEQGQLEYSEAIFTYLKKKSIPL